MGLPATSQLALALCGVLTTAGCALGAGGDIPYPTISPKAGMTGVSRSYFGFGVPSQWRQRDGTEPNYWEDASGRRRLYAEVFTGCGNRRHPDSPPPKLVSYPDDAPPRVRRTSQFHVPGADGAWRYELRTGDGEQRTALNVWIAGCEKEIWLVISADSGTAKKIASTMVAQRTKRPTK